MRVVRAVRDKLNLATNTPKLQTDGGNSCSEDLASYVARTTLEHHVARSVVEAKLAPMAGWVQELNELHEAGLLILIVVCPCGWPVTMLTQIILGDIRGLWECLMEHKDWQCEARTSAVEWAAGSLLATLQEWIAKASQELRVSNPKLQITMVCLRDVIDNTKKWIAQVNYLMLKSSC